MTAMALSFQRIYDKFYPRILRYMTRMVGENEAEDLTQEVFVKIDRSRGSFRGESQVSTWIYRIAANTALDRLRRVHARGCQGEDPSVIVDENGKESRDIRRDEDQSSAEGQIIRREMNGCIREVIDTLPEDYRSVIILGELEGFKDTEIAEVLGISLQAAKMRLHRGRALLKKALSTTCVFYRDERNELACDRQEADARLVQTATAPRRHNG